MVLNVHRNHKAYWGLGVWGRLYTYHYTCIKMGNDKSHFSVSLIVRDSVTKQCPQTIMFKEKGELKWNFTEVLLVIA